MKACAGSMIRNRYYIIGVLLIAIVICGALALRSGYERAFRHHEPVMANVNLREHLIGDLKPFHGASEFGPMTLNLSVNEAGTVSDAKMTNKFFDIAMLDQSSAEATAIKDVKTLKFRPFMENGYPVPAQGAMTICFAPEKPPTVHIPFPAIRSDSTVVITLRLTDPYWDPVSTIDILGDGSVFVTEMDREGQRQTRALHISAEKVNDLIVMARNADFFSLEAVYAGGNDFRALTTTIRIDDRQKSVVDIVGWIEGMPQAMFDIERAIEQAAGIDRRINQCLM